MTLNEMLDIVKENIKPVEVSEGIIRKWMDLADRRIEERCLVFEMISRINWN